MVVVPVSSVHVFSNLGSGEAYAVVYTLWSSSSEASRKLNKVMPLTSHAFDAYFRSVVSVFYEIPSLWEHSSGWFSQPDVGGPRARGLGQNSVLEHYRFHFRGCRGHMEGELLTTLGT